MQYKFDNETINPVNGFAVKSIPSVDSFFSILKENNNFQGFQFRGQSFESYKLEPTFLRVFQSLKIDDETYKKLLSDHYTNFLTSLRGRLNENINIKDEESEIWALGQHFGLKTPLLDWSASPWVALFFAFSDKREIRIRKIDPERKIREKR